MLESRVFFGCEEAVSPGGHSGPARRCEPGRDFASYRPHHVQSADHADHDDDGHPDAAAATVPGIPADTRGELLALDAVISALAIDFKASDGKYAKNDPFYVVLGKLIVIAKAAICENAAAVAEHVLRQFRIMVDLDPSHWMVGKGGGVELFMLELEALGCSTRSTTSLP